MKSIKNMLAAVRRLFNTRTYLAARKNQLLARQVTESRLLVAYSVSDEATVARMEAVSTPVACAKRGKLRGAVLPSNTGFEKFFRT